MRDRTRRGVSPSHFQPVEGRFFPYVDKTPGYGPDGDCWRWIRSLRPGKYAYGTISVHGFKRPATQVAWELENKRPFPAGLIARHSCDNPPCVNPAHIIPGTQAQNIADAIERGRRFRRVGHCKRGHPLEGDNLFLEGPKRWVRCLACRREQANARWPKIKAQRAQNKRDAA